MSETKAAPREHGDRQPEHMECATLKVGNELVGVPVEWKMLCEHPELVRAAMGSSQDTLHVGDDMTRDFRVLEEEARVALRRVFACLDPAGGGYGLHFYLVTWGERGSEPTAGDVESLPNGDRVGPCPETYRRWFMAFNRVGTGKPWPATDFIRVWDTFLRYLVESKWCDAHLVDRFQNWFERQTFAGIFPHSSAMLGLNCLYLYMTLLAAAVVLRDDRAVEEAVSRLGRLWTRVSHLWDGVEDEQHLAE